MVTLYGTCSVPTNRSTSKARGLRFADVIVQRRFGVLLVLSSTECNAVLNLVPRLERGWRPDVEIVTADFRWRA
jgi:hypothetical protein